MKKKITRYIKKYKYYFVSELEGCSTDFGEPNTFSESISRCTKYSEGLWDFHRLAIIDLETERRQECGRVGAMFVNRRRPFPSQGAPHRPQQTRPHSSKQFTKENHAIFTSVIRDYYSRLNLLPIYGIKIRKKIA